MVNQRHLAAVSEFRTSFSADLKVMEQTFLFTTNHVPKNSGSLACYFCWNINDRARKNHNFDLDFWAFSMKFLCFLCIYLVSAESNS